MFNLPKSTIANKVIPKNTFDEYTNSKQKQQFSDKISRIKWVNKLSPETINLSGEEVKEIQVFHIELRVKEQITDLLKIIDKAIPYHILFILKFEGLAMLITAQKHIHPTNEDMAVVDWNFSTDWIEQEKFNYQLNLKQNLDFVFEDICFQISGDGQKDKSIAGLISHEQQKQQLEKRIEKLTSEIKRCKQFNKKVELNRTLFDCQNKLNEIIN